MNTIKLTIRGVPVEVATAEQAFELIRLAEAAEKADSPARANGKAKEPGRVTIGDPQVAQWAVDLLRSIQSGGAAGVTSDKIQAALGVAHGKAIGSRTAVINKLLEESGFNQRDLYSNKKTAAGRIWKPRKAIEAAISALDQKLRVQP